MKIIVINGCGGAGKDSFIERCMESDKYEVYNISSITFVKKIAEIAGWDGKKDARGRKFLSDLKDAMTEYNDIPFKRVLSTINDILFSYRQFDMDTSNVIFFVQSREPKEIERWKKDYNARTLLIRRPQAEKKQFTNHADIDVFEYDYDYEYWNINDFDALRFDALQFIDHLGRMNWESDGEGIWED